MTCTVALADGASIFPGLERALKVTNTGPLVLLTGYQTPAALRRADQSRLRHRNVRGAAALAARAIQAARGQHTTLPAEALTTRLIVPLAREGITLNEQIKETGKLIEDRFRQHPHADVITSLPGIGTLLGMEFLAAAGGDLDAFATPDRLAGFAGLAPAPRDSGHIRGNLHYHRGLQRIFYTSALISIQFSPESRRFYDRKRTEDNHHTQAVLARRRVNVLWALLRHGRCYQSTPRPRPPLDISIRKPHLRRTCPRPS